MEDGRPLLSEMWQVKVDIMRSTPSAGDSNLAGLFFMVCKLNTVCSLLYLHLPPQMITLASRSQSGRRKLRWSWKSGTPGRTSSWRKPKPITGTGFIEGLKQDTRNNGNEGGRNNGNEGTMEMREENTFTVCVWTKKKPRWWWYGGFATTNNLGKSLNI